MEKNPPDLEKASIDRDSFHRLFIQNQRQIFSFILTLLPNAHDAEEVFQETCVVLLSKADSFKCLSENRRGLAQFAESSEQIVPDPLPEGGSRMGVKPETQFLAWACQIARYEVYNFRRRQQSERLRFSDKLVDAIAAKRIDAGDLFTARRAALADCVEKLPDGDRELVDIRYGEEITTKELAERTGRPANTVYKALNRIRRVLLECIERTISSKERRP